MGTTKMRASFVAALLLLAVVTAQSPQAPPDDDGNDADLDQTGSDDEPAEVKSAKQEPLQCPSSGGQMCSGKGKCEVTEENTVVCFCDAGYHGEDCSEMDDKFDVFWNSIMLKSKNAVLKPKFERASRRFNQLDNRVKAYDKRMKEDLAEERGWVERYVSHQSKFLDAHEKDVDKHQETVINLLKEVSELRQTLTDEIAEMTKTKRDLVNGREERLKEREERNQIAWKGLQGTVRKGNSLGELSRFHRIAEHWSLCKINPFAPECQDKDQKAAALPGVHLVVETKRPATVYPSGLAASEKEASESSSVQQKKHQLL